MAVVATAVVITAVVMVAHISVVAAIVVGISAASAHFGGGGRHAVHNMRSGGVRNALNSRALSRTPAQHGRAAQP